MHYYYIYQLSVLSHTKLRVGTAGVEMFNKNITRPRTYCDYDRYSIIFMTK